MTYIVNIVANDRTWYDSRIVSDDAVVFQNVNYLTGDDRSVNVVRQRFLQDWARRAIPNSIREGVGLTLTPTSDEIEITEGYAFVAGRFLNVPAGTFDASLEDSGLIDGTYYLAIRVDDGSGVYTDPSNISEGDTRDPKDEEAHIIARVLPYTKNHNELVIGKFIISSGLITSLEDYTAIQEWQASVISPVSVIPGLTTGSNSILLRAYSGTSPETINNLGIEEDKTRFYLNAMFDDQTGSTNVTLINNNGILETRTFNDSAYLGQDVLNLLIGGTERIDSSGNLINIGTINARVLGGNSSTDLIDTDSAQTMTNKTLTSPIQTGGTLNSGLALTVDSTELNQLEDRIVGGTANDDIVTNINEQTINNKTLVTPIIASIKSSALYTHSLPDVANDTIVLINAAQTLDTKKFKNFILRDSGDNNDYIFSTSALSAPRTITIPDGSVLTTTASDNTIVFTETTQTLTNKAITSSTFSGGLTGTATLTSLIASNNIDIGNFELKARTFESDVSTGTAPFTIASTTKVGNLNADFVDGLSVYDAGTSSAHLWSAYRIRTTALGDVSGNNTDTISFKYIDGSERETLTINNVGNADTVDGSHASAFGTATDVAIIKEYLCIGSANYGVMPCTLVGISGGTAEHYAEDLNIENVYGAVNYSASSATRSIFYKIPLAFSLGGTDNSQKQLIINEVHIKLADADTDNSIKNIYLSGVSSSSIYNSLVTSIDVEDTNSHEITANYTVSTTTKVLYVRLELDIVSSNELSIDYVAVQYYYESDTS